MFQLLYKNPSIRLVFVNCDKQLEIKKMCVFDQRAPAIVSERGLLAHDVLM